VISWYQRFAFICNLYCYIEAMPVNAEGGRMRYLPLSLAEDYIVRLGAANGGGGGGGVGVGVAATAAGGAEEVDEVRRDEKAEKAEKDAAGGDDVEVQDIVSNDYPIPSGKGGEGGEGGEEGGAEGGEGGNEGAWSEATMEAVGGITSSPPQPPPGGRDDWMLDSWRWLKQPNLDLAENGNSWAENGNSSPWQRLTERGLQWRVEGCPQEVCAAVFSCKAGVRRAHLLDYTLSGALLLELYTFDGIGAMAGVVGDVLRLPPPVTFTVCQVKRRDQKKNEEKSPVYRAYATQRYLGTSTKARAPRKSETGYTSRRSSSP
jgi:hypothetical protein